MDVSTVVWDQSQQKIVSVKSAKLETGSNRTGLLEERYKFHDDGDYPVVPSLHSVCSNALGNQISLESLFCFSLAMIPSLDVELEGNIFAFSNRGTAAPREEHLQGSENRGGRIL
ncbi:hypothetical protein N7466_002516 [Penicillium verhagenii]|uniref:uncharacterized protein n=1 Tax=Penicillium verhagenii TaxID=1562060 RepID=UPI0025452283|nr:uncharacterized protein N7466_002516 [Penicillium verhagenii]KAJ5939382.1 hypothetical protein N7466_002516 [Penicillium verhagenii]